MAMNFPSSPFNGQRFAPGSGPAYIFNGTSWQPAPRQTALPFNYIVNPDFSISQETGDNVVTAGQYPADQWIVDTGGIAGCNAQRVAAASPNGSSYILRATSAAASVAAGNYLGLIHYGVEGLRIGAYKYGTPDAVPLVLRFWVRSSQAGTFGGSFRNNGATRGYTFRYTIAAGEVNTWVERSVWVLGDYSGTWEVNTNLAMDIWFTFVNGGTYATAPGMWTAGNLVGPTGMTNVSSSIAATYDIADVGLYLDPEHTGKAPPWHALDKPGMNEWDVWRYWIPIRSAKGMSNPVALIRGRFPLPTTLRLRSPATAVVSTVYIWDTGYLPVVTSAGWGGWEQCAEMDIYGTPFGTGTAGMMLPDYPGYIAVSARF
jgi:hypothetical protein